MIILFLIGREIDSYFEIAKMVNNEIEEYFIEYSDYPDDLENVISKSNLAELMRDKKIKYYYSKYDDSKNYSFSILPRLMGVDYIYYNSKRKRYELTD